MDSPVWRHLWLITGENTEAWYSHTRISTKLSDSYLHGVISFKSKFYNVAIALGFVNDLKTRKSYRFLKAPNYISCELKKHLTNEHCKINL